MIKEVCVIPSVMNVRLYEREMLPEAERRPPLRSTACRRMEKLEFTGALRE